MRSNSLPCREGIEVLGAEQAELHADDADRIGGIDLRGGLVGDLTAYGIAAGLACWDQICFGGPGPLGRKHERDGA